MPVTGAGSSLMVDVPTADGARIAVKRRPRPGGVPVIFVHGLGSNADLWDLPEVRGKDYHYRSLASVLHDAGYDAWLMNLRGHGAPRMLSQPPPGQTDWCVDHFILYDLPAVVEHVADQTGQRPFVIGASMGSMTAAGYVQGAVRVRGPGSSGQGSEVRGQEDGGAGREPGAGSGALPMDRGAKPAGADRIVADPAVAVARQAKLRGAVFFEFPAALRWPRSAYDADGGLKWRSLLRDWRRTDENVNYPFEVLSRLGWLQAILEAAGQMPLGWLRGERTEPWYRKLPPTLADTAQRLESAAVHAMLQVAAMFNGAGNNRAEVLLNMRRLVLDHMKAGVLRQLAKCVRRGAFVSDLGDRDHVYSDHYGHVALPTLVVQGSRDRIASPDVVRTAFFDRIAAPDKRFLLFDGLGHGELEAAPVASEQVYPQVLAWLNERRA